MEEKLHIMVKQLLTVTKISNFRRRACPRQPSCDTPRDHPCFIYSCTSPSSRTCAICRFFRRVVHVAEHLACVVRAGSRGVGVTIVMGTEGLSKSGG